MNQYRIVSDTETTITAENPEDAADIWASLMTAPSPEAGTVWHDVAVYRITAQEPKLVARLKIPIHPDLPRCTPSGSREMPHEWTAPDLLVGPFQPSEAVREANPNISGIDLCSRCGLARVVNGDATDPADGSSGHRSVRYVSLADIRDRITLHMWNLSSYDRYTLWMLRDGRVIDLPVGAHDQAILDGDLVKIHDNIRTDGRHGRASAEAAAIALLLRAGYVPGMTAKATHKLITTK